MPLSIKMQYGDDVDVFHYPVGVFQYTSPTEEHNRSFAVEEQNWRNSTSITHQMIHYLLDTTLLFSVVFEAICECI